MKTILRSLLIVISTSVIVGCAGSPQIIQTKLSESGIGVFKEKLNDTVLPKGMSSLSVKVSFKTHDYSLHHYYAESCESPHGKQSFRVLLNIDSQPILWKAEGIKETTPIYGKDGKRIPDPEAGDGVRYNLDKKLVITPGKHRVFFSLPDEGYYKEFEIYVLKGNENYLELKPVYHIQHQKPRTRNFSSEIEDFKAYHNTVLCL